MSTTTCQGFWHTRVKGSVWWGRLRLKACKKHRNGSCYKDLARVMNEAIMRETIAFFSKTKHYGQLPSLSGEVCVRARLLCHHLALQCSTPTYLRVLIVKFFMFSDFLAHYLEYVAYRKLTYLQFKIAHWLNQLLLYIKWQSRKPNEFKMTWFLAIPKKIPRFIIRRQAL